MESDPAFAWFVILLGVVVIPLVIGLFIAEWREDRRAQKAKQENEHK